MNSLIRNGMKLKFTQNALRYSICQQNKFSTSLECKKQSSHTAEQNPDNPIKFIGSQAQTFKAKFTRVGNSDPDQIPKYQPFIVIGSVAIFLLYFCVLREESDVDIHLNKSLFENVPGIEAGTLISLYKYNLENNKDNTDVIKRMLELGIDPLKIK